MISPWMVKLMGHLPKGLLTYISKKVLSGYLNRCADIKVKGIENLNEVERPVIFICNHLSNSDALVLSRVLKSENLTFVAGKKLNQNSLTQLGMCITKTINIKPNSADKDAISKVINTVKNGNNILMFPEGTRSRTASLAKGKRGVVLIQKLTKAAILPIGISGTEKLLPISDKDMALESFHNAEVNVNIGKQIDIPPQNKGENKHVYEDRISDLFMKKIAELLPEQYRGVYKS
ncbi:lysophospholipid acyltransferase family protein [Clostridium ljungdahlii]|uniref:1-acyl-sn-glycerol-3-phosphate acyltransferase n=1 Tax=Clostridium ljungdahlii TaxID=1538 RepID=A0A168R497_9CLOT|nr:lysophospholipid acyltransferase family protein [Clostridium ljungdahlii]OAA90024.1 1-acyl-sn-glycerol-3-phosphate acyltransferase [Clostridium ljungdahlii]